MQKQELIKTRYPPQGVHWTQHKRRFKWQNSLSVRKKLSYSKHKISCC